MYKRRKTKKVFFGDVPVGGHSPISVQSMTNTRTSDIKTTVEQINRLEKLGCEIIRTAVPDMESARAIKQIKKRINIPIVADIHFDHKLALESVKSGVDALRINPGNIGEENKIKKVAEACQKANIPIRVGSNSGSIEKSILKKYDGPTAEAMVESALQNVRVLEDNNFFDIVISLKSTSIFTTLEAYSLMAKKVDYP